MSNVAKSAPYSADAELAPRKVIAAWGVIGGRQNRCASVLEMISGFDLICLKKTKEGYPSVRSQPISGNGGHDNYGRGEKVSDPKVNEIGVLRVASSCGGLG